MGRTPQAPQPKATEDRLYVNASLGDGFQHAYPGAYAASDIYAMLVFPGNVHRPLGQIAALSISTHRDAFPVTRLATVAPVGFTQGHRTTAGSLIFNTIDRTVLAYRLKLAGDHQSHTHADALPLFDIQLSYVNEAGMLSYEALEGVRILDYGKSASLENLHPVESYSYMALNYVPMRNLYSAEKHPARFTLTRPLSREPQGPVPGLRTSPSFDPEIQGELPASDQA